MEINELLTEYKPFEPPLNCGQKIFYKVQKGGKKYALKIIKGANDVRVQQEIDILRNIQIPFVPTVFETGEVYDQSIGINRMYILEDLINGITLKDLLASGVRFNLRKAYGLLNELLKIEVALENKGIIHRDIKPGNIIIDEKGQAWLIDFGIAKILGEDSLTQTNAIQGVYTPGYAPFGQIMNERSEIDVRQDLYAIGVTVYESVTGKNPFITGAKSQGDIILRTQTFIPTSLSFSGDTSVQFSRFIDMLIAKNNSQRPSTANKALQYLNAIHDTLIFEE
jgi:eukaryotic-like serine/threonine-protein kinase